LNGLNGLNFRKKEQSRTPAEFEKEFFQNGARQPPRLPEPLFGPTAEWCGQRCSKSEKSNLWMKIEIMKEE